MRKISLTALPIAVIATSAIGAPLPDPDTLDEIVVSAHPLGSDNLAQASAVIDGDKLKKAITASIGTTVAGQPGVHAATFGNASTRPIIRGLGGARVKVMEDQIDALDASVTSPDHAAGVEPFIADRIEILKGSSTLLYGSGAIGGIVDVQTGRLPHRLSDAGVTGRAEVRQSDNANMRNAAARLDGSVERFAWHVDGFFRDADEYDIPGFAESAAQRASEAGGDEEEEEEAFGRLPGSQLESSGGALGASYIGDRLFIGVSFSGIDSLYGLPGGHGHEEEGEGAEEEEEEEGNPILDLKQRRTDFEIAYKDPLPGFSELIARVGINDYEHQEIEPNGEVATEFENDAYEARISLTHDAIAGWTGQLGLQFGDREFSALGEEAFVPPVDTRNWGAFWVAQKSLTLVDLEAGIRFGEVEHTPIIGPRRSFDTYGLSAGVILPLSGAWQLSLQADLSQRAPIAEELYSNGPHLATNSFELGDDGLAEESARNLALTASYEGARSRFSASAYVSSFDDFIYERALGIEEDGLAVFQFRADDARFTGIEAELQLELGQWQATDTTLRLYGDFVEANLSGTDLEELPRIPPARFGAGLDVTRGNFDASLDVLRVFRQSDRTSAEFASAAYTDVSAFASYTIPRGETSFELFLRGDNLTDTEQRLHTSFIKEFAPLPGRTLTAGFRVEF